MNPDLIEFILEIIYLKKKGGAYVKTLDEHFDIGTHSIALYALNNNVFHFDSFGVAHIPKGIENKNVCW